MYEVGYCPTKEMIADFSTMPVQGALFHKFRNAVLRIVEKCSKENKLQYLEAFKKKNLMDPNDTIRLQECVEQATNKEERTEDKQQQDANQRNNDNSSSSMKKTTPLWLTRPISAIYQKEMVETTVLAVGL